VVARSGFDTSNAVAHPAGRHPRRYHQSAPNPSIRRPPLSGVSS